MSALIGTALLQRLVASKSGVPAADVAKVLDAYNEAVVTLLRSGGRVRALGIGYFDVIETKPTRRRNPQTDRMMKVKAKKKIVFRESRKR